MAPSLRSTSDSDAETRPRKRPISHLPNMLTLANAGLGLLAISKAVDALATPERFGDHLEMSCWLVLIAGIFDALDGKVARLTNSFSDLGAQLDSLADALTFGVAPAIIAKVFLEHEGFANQKLNFAFAAAFALMAILRLARFNVEDDDEHVDFLGLPTPAAAGMLIVIILMFPWLNGDIQKVTGEPSLMGNGLRHIPESWRSYATEGLLAPLVFAALPTLALLMVSRVRYVHFATRLSQVQSRRALIPLVFGGLAFFLAPVLFLFLLGLTYVGSGLFGALRGARRADSKRAERDRTAA